MKLQHKACMPGVAYMPYKIQANKMISLNIEYYMICDMIANIVQYIEQSTVTSHCITITIMKTAITIIIGTIIMASVSGINILDCFI